MRDFLLSQWRGITGTLLALAVSSLFLRIFYKFPKIKWFLKPNEAAKDLITEHHDLSTRYAELEAKYRDLQGGKEFLLDELSIARAVRDNQRDQLDAIKASESNLRIQLEGIKKLVGHDII